MTATQGPAADGAATRERPVHVAAARGTAITLAGQGVRFCVQTLSLLVLARLLTPADFGLVSMVTAIVGIAAVLGDFGLSLAAMQAATLSHAQRSNLFWLNAGIGAVLSVLVFALAGPIASFYHEPDLAVIVRALSTAFLINGLTTQFKAELSRALRFGWLSVADIAAQAVGFGAALAAALAGGGYWSLVAQQLGIALTTLAIAAAVSHWRPGLPNRAAPMRRLLSFGANTMGVQAITYVSSNVDNVLVGKYWGPASLGVYSRAYTLFELPVQQLAAPLTRVVLPILSRVQDETLFMAYVRRAQLMMCYGLLGAFAVGASIAQPLVSIVLGPQWSGAAPIFQVLAIGGSFQALTYVYYWVFLAKAKTAIQLRFSVVGRIAMVGFIFAGVQFSSTGAAIGASAGFALLWLLYTAWGMPRAGMSARAMNVDAARAIALFTSMAIISQLAYHSVLQGHSAVLQAAGGLAVDAACLALSLAFARIRADLRTVAGTLRLVVDRRRAQAIRITSEPSPRASVTDSV